MLAGNSTNSSLQPWTGGVAKNTTSGQRLYLPALQNSHLPQVIPGSKQTRSPGFKDVTPSPTSATVPAHSWPSLGSFDFFDDHFVRSAHKNALLHHFHFNSPFTILNFLFYSENHRVKQVHRCYANPRFIRIISPAGITDADDIRSFGFKVNCHHFLPYPFSAF